MLESIAVWVPRLTCYVDTQPKKNPVNECRKYADWMYQAVVIGGSLGTWLIECRA